MKPQKDAKWVLTRIFMYFIIALTIVISLFPVLWVVLSSFKTNAEILSGAYVMPSSLQAALDA